MSTAVSVRSGATPAFGSERIPNRPASAPKLTMVSPDVMHNQITITDPKVFTGPWTFTYAYKRLPGYEMLEYVCEDNREYVDEKGGTHLKLLDHH